MVPNHIHHEKFITVMAQSLFSISCYKLTDMLQRTFYVLLCLFLCATAIDAQQKKNLTSEDYGKWQSIGANDLSPNGQWIAYQIVVQEDNDTMYVINRNSDKVYKIEFASQLEFSKDNKWIAYRIGLPFKEAEKLRDQSKPIEYKMGVLNLETGKKEVIQNTTRFGFSRNGKFLAVYLAPPKESKDKDSILLVKNMSDNTTHTIGNVTEYAFNKKSDYISYIVESGNAAGNSVELLNLNTYTLQVVASDTLKFSKLNWQKEGDGLSFFKTFKKEGYEEENAIVNSYTGIYQSPVLKMFNPTELASFPKDMRIYNGSALRLSDDMSSVFFGLKPWTVKPKKEDKKPADSIKVITDSIQIKTDSTKTSLAKKSNPDEKLPAVDIWHWKDPEIQPRQKITYKQDKEASFLSVWNMDNGHFYQLAKESAPDALLTGNQKYAIASTDKKYKPAFKEDFSDFYLINVKTGEEKLLYEKSLYGFYTGPRSSPDGNFLYYFKDKHWWTYTIATQQNTNITQNIKADFWDTRDDHTASKPPVGLGGWLKDDKEMLVYDEYNVWAVTPDGKSSRKLTEGEKDETMFRVNRVDFEDPFIDDAKPIYLSAYGDKSKKFGYYKLENGKVDKLIFESLSVSRLTKAKDANAFLYADGPYTWWSQRGQAFDTDTGWRLDYHMASPGLAASITNYAVDRASAWDTRWSDHSPVVVDYLV